MNLPESDVQLQKINEILNSIDKSEIPLELDSALNELLNQKDNLELDYQNKIDSILAIIKNRQDSLSERNQEIKDLSQLIETESNTINWLKKYLIKHLRSQNISHLRTQRFNLEIVPNNSQRRLVMNKDISINNIPEEYQMIYLGIDYSSVRKALESGEELDFAFLAEPEFQLKIS